MRSHHDDYPIDAPALPTQCSVLPDDIHDMLAWELRRPNAVTWEVQSLGPPKLKF